MKQFLLLMTFIIAAPLHAGNTRKSRTRQGTHHTGTINARKNKEFREKQEEQQQAHQPDERRLKELARLQAMLNKKSQ